MSATYIMHKMKIEKRYSFGMEKNVVYQFTFLPRTVLPIPLLLFLKPFLHRQTRVKNLGEKYLLEDF